MELPFAVEESSYMNVSEPQTVGVQSMYDNVRLTYFTPSTSLTAPRQHPQPLVVDSPNHTQFYRSNEDNNNDNNEDCYVAVDEESFIHLSSMTRTDHRLAPQNHVRPTGTALNSNRDAQLSKTASAVVTKDEPKKFDVLELLLDSSASAAATAIVSLCDGASHEAGAAYRATRSGDLTASLMHHIQAARLFREAAVQIQFPHGQGHGVEEQQAPAGYNTIPTSPLPSHRPLTLVYNLLLLSQTHAHHAQALLQSGTVTIGEELMQSYWKLIAKQDQRYLNPESNNGIATTDMTSAANTSTTVTTALHLSEERLRATIRASMNRTNEIDMTESTFLAPVTSTRTSATSVIQSSHQALDTTPITTTVHNHATRTQQPNPIDDMMKLEKELRDMDMTIDLGVGMGNSMAHSFSDFSHFQQSPKDPDGTYCILPSTTPLGASYMSSSSMWTSHSIPKSNSTQHTHTNTLPIHQHGRGRADRVKTSVPKTHISSVNTPSTMLGKNTTLSTPMNHSIHNNIHNNNLDASWWGHASILASSTVSLGSSIVGIKSQGGMGSSSILSPPFKQGGDVTTTTVQSPSTSSPITSKQLLQLLDTIRTLGDENASLLHEVDMARKAQLEAKATREAMKVFQEEYAKRFSTLKSALEQYQKEHPIHIHHPIHSSSYVAAEAELRKKDEMIEKLTVELSQEKEESRKKDSALRKYENFYKEVKARSAQKAKERQEEKNKQV